MSKNEPQTKGKKVVLKLSKDSKIEIDRDRVQIFGDVTVIGEVLISKESDFSESSRRTSL